MNRDDARRNIENNQEKLTVSDLINPAVLLSQKLSDTWFRGTPKSPLSEPDKLKIVNPVLNSEFQF